MFNQIVDDYAVASGSDSLLQCEVDHVDGTFNALQRNEKLDWLKEQTEGNLCRILCNARCLSEGVDVPALDAVMFLNPRNSVVDVVQSVGRVMRRSPGKEYGYVILPIGVPSERTPEDTLKDNQKYKVVWQVLQALRAHDDRFNAMINKIELNRVKDDQLQVIGVPGREPESGAYGDAFPVQGMFSFPQIAEWRDAIYAKIVQKVGDRRYWETWAKDVSEIAERHTTRIKALLADGDPDVAEVFAGFLDGLRRNLNDAITEEQAIEMLSQHSVTKPVFDALFEDYSFASHNPVSIVMQQVLDVLDRANLQQEAESLGPFYESVRRRAEGIDNAEGKQRIVIELYEKFFKLAFHRTAESLGIVYTPVQIVDFIIESVEFALNQEFGASISDRGVHVLDPFTGTGTFVVRLLQKGMIRFENLREKYRTELHANEIVLLAYYIAAINIEAAYHGIVGAEYEPFEGIVLADTFQSSEGGGSMDEVFFPQNNERLARQRHADITVIMANPPYSVGQGSQNDGTGNLTYSTVDRRIEATYAGEIDGGVEAQPLRLLRTRLSLGERPHRRARCRLFCEQRVVYRHRLIRWIPQEPRRRVCQRVLLQLARQPTDVGRDLTPGRWEGLRARQPHTRGYYAPCEGPRCRRSVCYPLPRRRRLPDTGRKTLDRRGVRKHRGSPLAHDRTRCFGGLDQSTRPDFRLVRPRLATRRTVHHDRSSASTRQES